ADGIRDRNVTGVQTCALPILRAVFIGQPGVIDEARTADESTEAFEFVPRSLRCVAVDGVVECGVEGEFVDVPPRRGLVEHCMRGVRGCGRWCGEGFGGHVSPRANRVLRRIE